MVWLVWLDGWMVVVVVVVAGEMEDVGSIDV